MAAVDGINKSVYVPLDYDELMAKLAMLTANLTVICGEGFDSFNRHNEDIQQNYIWGCSTLADECHSIVKRSSGV